MLKRLVVLNLKDCKRLKNFPSRVEMDALQVLNLTGCLKVDQLPEALGRIKSFKELHVDRTAITELPSFVSSLINLESLSFGGHGKIQPSWWTSSTNPFGLLSKQHPQRSIPSLAGLDMLKDLNLSYCNLEQVPESIGGLSCLEYLNLKWNNFTSLPGSMSQLSRLNILRVDGCKKLEVLPKLPPDLFRISASDCTSLREVIKNGPIGYRYNDFFNCPKLFKNVIIDSEGSISKTECLDSSIASQGFIHPLCAFLGYLGIPTNRCEFFTQDIEYCVFDIRYHGDSVPEWFTNRSTENHVKVELPSDWCFNKFRGYGTCVVFKIKKPHNFKGYYVKNFDGASLTPYRYIPDLGGEDYFQVGIQDMIWLRYTRNTEGWKEAKNFVTFCFEENNEDFVEVKECGVRLICDEDLQQYLPTPTQHGGAMTLCNGHFRGSIWSW